MPRNGTELPYRLRLSLAGYNTAEVLPHVFANWQVAPVRTFVLDRVGTVDSTMAWLPGWTVRDTVHPGADSVRFGDYHLSRTEVTNREYKRFVDAGGYSKREYWTDAFVNNGKTVSWEEAIAQFRDRTGLPSPSTWSNATYAEGQADYPVGGVSWHEADAYARFAKSMLPSAAHWARANRHSRMSNWIVIPTSNLNATAPRRVAKGNMNAYGLYDMAGNLREWCANPMDGGSHATRGAGWGDAEFHVGWVIPKSDFDRAADNGIRLMQSRDADSTLAHVTGRIARTVLRDLAVEKPVSDAEYRSYPRLFEYDKAPVNATRDGAGETDQYRWERVSFDAAYGGERMWVWLLFPKSPQQIYQPVIYWPGSGAMTVRSLDPNAFEHRSLAFIVRSGRVVIVPAYKGAYDRDDSTFSTTSSVEQPTTYFRDLSIQWVKDFRRTIDYLESRQDIDAAKVGFFGVSWGGSIAPVVLAVEPRVKSAVLNIGGVWLSSRALPEVDPFNYLPRAHAPTLMLNGRHDIVFPYEKSQLPFFRLLGTPAADKKHFVYPTSHDVPMQDMVRESLAWFDKYLGPMTRRP
jgi:dienelactone hydrolase